MSSPKVRDDSEKGDVFSKPFVQLSHSDSWSTIHGRVNRDDHIWVIGSNSFSNLSSTQKSRMQVCNHPSGKDVTKVVKEFPLIRVCREVLV